MACGGDIVDTGGVKSRHGKLLAYLTGKIQIRRTAHPVAGKLIEQRRLAFDATTDDINKIDLSGVEQELCNPSPLCLIKPLWPVLIECHAHAHDKLRADGVADFSSICRVKRVRFSRLPPY